MKCKINYWAVAFLLLSINFTITSFTYNHHYRKGYQEACTMFRQWLLDVDYAEYDKKTGEWKLSDADDIRGRLIEPVKRGSFVNIDEHAKSLEDELALVRKQQATLSKRKSQKLDTASVP